MRTKTFTDQYNELYSEVENQLKKLINWISVPSKDYSCDCLKLDSLLLDYDEIIYLDGKVLLINQDGYQYDLSCIDFDTLCDLTDRLSVINPYTAEERPLRHLSDSGINLSDFLNFSKSGNIKGMKKQYYGKGALLVQFGNYIYNVTSEPEIYFEHSQEPDQEYY